MPKRKRGVTGDNVRKRRAKAARERRRRAKEETSTGYEVETEGLQLYKHSETNLVENLPEPGIEPRISGSMENICSHEEPESGRRPSRKAALVAAKKIFNTVNSYVVKDNDSLDILTSTTTSPKPTSTPRPYTRPKPKKTALANVDLQMECYDDLLSPIQAEFLIKAQVQYNMTMKNLRELMACNVKVIQTDPFGLPTAVAPVPNVALKPINMPNNVILSGIKPIKVETLVVPMTLSSASSQSSPKL